jgi:putative addiction module component (TIGR02574 family)
MKTQPLSVFWNLGEVFAGIDRLAASANAPLMSLARYPKLAKLPRRERQALANELWLSAMDDRLPVSPAQRKLLDERWREYQRGSAKPISLRELKRRLDRQ